ncbi:MAG: low molecular weight phosphotyrosine protein phosphatase [Lachnospiraceae bacterium]|nr:low molecular weight phosphotyrosine protein phosphatase [Lachnospiraceae bacterium]
MVRVLFICHGNICRSTMAQFVFQDMINKKGLTDRFYIDSKATSTEEIGNGPHYGTVRKLNEVGVPVLSHRASQMKRSDYDNYDYIIGMDQWNYKNMNRILGADPDGKVSLLLDFTDSPRDIADPWYTGNFDMTYNDVMEGCTAFLNYLKDNGEI